MMKGKLPEMWNWKRLGDITRVLRGASPRPKGDPKYYGGTIPWIKISDVTGEKGKYLSKTVDTVNEEGALKSKYLSKGSLILSICATVCVPKILSIDGCIHDGFVYFPDLPKDINLSFLYYYFESIRIQVIQENRQGMTQVNLNTGIVSNFHIPLPPLPEQERIVAKIEALFTQLEAGTAALRRIQVGLKRYKASVLKAACDGSLTIPPLRRGDGELPEGWEWKSASHFCTAVECGSTPRADLMTYGYGEVPFIKVYNLSFDGNLNFTVKPTFISTETHNTKLKRSRVFPGDVLTNIVGPPLGKVSIVPDKYPEWNINQAIVLFRTGKGVDSKYLSYVLQSPGFQNRLKATSRATAGQYNVSLSTCRIIPMPIPSLSEQIEIVTEVERRLSVVNEIESVVTASLARAGRLRQAILKRAFEGRLV